MRGNDRQLLMPWTKQLRSARIQLLLGFMLALVTVLFGIGLLSLSGWFITAAALFTAFDIYTPGAGIRLFAVGRTLSRYIERLVNHDLVLKLQARWRVALFKRIQQLPLIELLKVKTADSVQQLTRNLDAMDNLLLRLIVPAVVFVLASSLLLLFWSFYSLPMALLLAAAALTVLIISTTLAAKTRRLALHQLQSTQRLRRQSMAVTESMTELLAWGAYSKHQRHLLQQADTQELRDDRQLAYQHRSIGLVEIIAQGLLLVAVWILADAYQQGQVSSAEMIMLTLSVLAWQELAAELPMQWGGYGKTLAAARRLSGLSGQATTQIQATAELTAAEASGAAASLSEKQCLMFDDVTVEQRGRTLVRDLSARFEFGKVHWLQGSSGSGKSTLAGAIMGWHPLTEGRITMSKATTEVWPPGYLTQQTEVLDASVRDNLNPAKRALPDQQLWHVLRLVELDTVIAALPEQLNCLIGARGINLSGGQYRRLALARVLLQDKSIMVLDEPLAGLDRALAARVMTAIYREYPERLWWVISHVSLQELDGMDIVLGEQWMLRRY